MKYVTETEHELGLSVWVSIHKNNKIFIVGGENSSELKIYSLETLKVIKTIRKHEAKSNMGFFYEN